MTTPTPSEARQVQAAAANEIERVKREAEDRMAPPSQIRALELAARRSRPTPAASRRRGELNERAFVPLTCPFCHEDDFDQWGLQSHLMMRDCPNYGRYDSRNQLPEDTTP